MSVGPISHQEIESWARLFRIAIGPFEVDVLRRLDREYRVYLDEKAHPKKSIGEALQEIANQRPSQKTQQVKKPAPVKKK